MCGPGGPEGSFGADTVGSIDLFDYRSGEIFGDFAAFDAARPVISEL
jgi:hypothetical protein